MVDEGNGFDLVRYIWLFWRAQGGPFCIVLLAFVWLVVVSSGNTPISSPGQPEGALIQVWLPLGASVISARASYDRLGVLGRSRRQLVLLAKAGWLSFVSGSLVMLAATERAPKGSHFLEISPALPVCLVIATVFVLSRHLEFSTVAIIAFVEGIILYFLANPALRGSRSNIALLWNGAHGYGTVIGAGVVVLAIAWNVNTVTRPASIRGAYVLG